VIEYIVSSETELTQVTEETCLYVHVLPHPYQNQTS